MASLSTHLRRPDDHGRLPFHADCPVCRRERLAGANPPDALVGHRTQALLAASVLALSTSSPAAAVAAEPDQEQEGVIAPDRGTPAEPLPDAPVDPGGPSTPLPLDAGSAVETEASTMPADEIVEEPAASDDAVAATPDEVTTRDSAAPEQPPPIVDAAPEQPAAPSPREQQPIALSAGPEPAGAPAAEERRREAEPKAPPRTRVAAPARTVLRLPAQPPQPVSPTTQATVRHQQASTQAARASVARTAQEHERVHVVRPDESLWSIARELLGEDASVARIAREVNRLWQLNSGRIGTGDPDLLVVGTKLTLR